MGGNADDGDVKDERAKSVGPMTLDQLLGSSGEKSMQVDGFKAPPHDKQSAYNETKGHLNKRKKKEKRKGQGRSFSFAPFRSSRSSKTSTVTKGSKGSKGSKGPTGPSDEMLMYGLMAGVFAVGLSLVVGRR
jgi:hypothetical protein